MASCGFWHRHTHSNQFNKEPGHQSLKTLFTLYVTSDIEFYTSDVCHFIVSRKAFLHQVFYLSDSEHILLFYHSIYLLLSTLFIRAFPFYSYAIKLDQVCCFFFSPSTSFSSIFFLVHRHIHKLIQSLSVPSLCSS